MLFTVGANASCIASYFEENGARPCPPEANPAEWMLEVIGAGDPNYKGLQIHRAARIQC